MVLFLQLPLSSCVVRIDDNIYDIIFNTASQMMMPCWQFDANLVPSQVQSNGEEKVLLRVKFKTLVAVRKTGHFYSFAVVAHSCGISRQGCLMALFTRSK